MKQHQSHQPFLQFYCHQQPIFIHSTLSQYLIHTLSIREKHKMQQIDFQSSEDINDSYSSLTFQQADLFKEDQNPIKTSSADTPTYQEIIDVMATIRSCFPQISIRSVVAHLHNKISAKSKSHQSSREKSTFALQCKYAAKSFVLLGHGIARMRKQICMDSFSLQISDAREYERVMNRVFLCSYRRLESFISSKCDLEQYDCKLIPIKNEADMRSLMEIMRISRKQLGANDLHCFFKLLKAVYEDYPVSLSKKEACSLYKSMHNWVEFRKRKEQSKGLGLLDEQQKDFSLDLEQQWPQQMTKVLVQLYIKDPSSVSAIESSLKSRFPNKSNLIQPSSIKQQLATVFKQAIKKAQQQMDYPQCLELGSRFKRLERLDEPRIKAILCDSDAAQVRSILCEFYLLKTFDIRTLSCTILSINQFVNKREHEIIAQNLKKTMQANSMTREQYAFAGKRNQVLVLKKNNKKPRQTKNISELL